jgi:5-methyltetrahydrofolate--homocysteine methyltransferase
MIGLSGLITPSLDEMVTVAAEMEREGFTMPLLIGGATTSRVHTALKIEPAYSGPTLHVLDASRAVGVASALTSDNMKGKLVEETRTEYAMIREERASRGESKLASLADARANGFPADFAAHPPVKPATSGVRVMDAVLPRVGTRGQLPGDPQGRGGGRKRAVAVCGRAEDAGADRGRALAQRTRCRRLLAGAARG